ncbi:MAG: hypothetical protein ACLTMM_08220 [Lachnospiraceae bacterium]|nr:hypothetical protein [Acutalibacteraceae bacterium]
MRFYITLSKTYHRLFILECFKNCLAMPPQGLDLSLGVWKRENNGYSYSYNSYSTVTEEKAATSLGLHFFELQHNYMI